jgi:adenylate cyclase
LRDGMAASLMAVQLDERNPYSHYAVAITHTFSGAFETAIQAAQRAVSLSHSFALGYLVLGAAHLYAGKPKEAIDPLEHGLRLSPYDPQNFSWLLLLALAYHFAAEPQQALSTARRALSLRPHWHAALKLVVLCCRALGDLQQARSAVMELQVRDSGGDLIQSIARFNSAWAGEIETAVHQTEDEPPKP